MEGAAAAAPAVTAPKQALTPKDLGFSDKYPKDNRILQLFVSDKTKKTKAMRKEATVSTALSFLSKAVNFVSNRIPEEDRIDDWDFFRHPKAHEAFLKALNQSCLGPEGKDNYRKAVVQVNQRPKQCELFIYSSSLSVK